MQEKERLQLQSAVFLQLAKRISFLSAILCLGRINPSRLLQTQYFPAAWRIEFPAAYTRALCDSRYL